MPQLYLCEGVIACKQLELPIFTMRLLRSGEIALNTSCDRLLEMSTSSVSQ